MDLLRFGDMGVGESVRVGKRVRDITGDGGDAGIC